MNIIVDLDGTLSFDQPRRHLIESHGWEAYFANCHEDKINESVYLFLCAMAPYHKIIIITGRSDATREETELWFKRHEVPYSELHMREAEHYKQEGLDAVPIMSHVELKLAKATELGLTPENTLCVLEDMDDLVTGWRDAGFHCWQVVAQGYIY